MTDCQRLAVLVFPGDVTMAMAHAVIHRLAGSDSLVVVDAILVERHWDGTLGVTGFSEGTPTEADEAAFTALTWFVEQMLDSPPDALAGEGPADSFYRPGISVSFLAELRLVLPTATVCVALVTSHLDVGAAVAALRPFPGARVVYGTLPPGALAGMVPAPLEAMAGGGYVGGRGTDL